MVLSRLYINSLLHPFVIAFMKLHTWIYVGLLGLALLTIFFLVFMKQEKVDQLPPYVYFSFIFITLVFIDISVPQLSMLPLYLACLGNVLLRSKYQNALWISISFASTFIVIDALTVGEMYWIKWIADLLIFVLFTLVFLQLHIFTTEMRRNREKNKYLIERLKEAQIRIHEVNDEIEETYRRDYLTGLYNLGGFQEQVLKSLASIKDRQMYHVVSIDLTDFKQVNMREGIEFGDQMLVSLARQLKSELQPYTHIARYDGDQFAIGFLGDSFALRLCIETVDRVLDSLRTERTIINYCIGTATYPNEATNADDLIRLAETRLSIEQRRVRHKEDERKRHLEKLSAVGQLAAGLAHEIRNPLTSIRGFVQLSAAESKEVKRWESIILPEIDRINDLLKQFLDLSDSRPSKYCLFQLDQLIYDVHQLLMPKAILMGHELKIQDHTTSLLVEADPEELKQVLINLIQNGLDALDEHGRVVVTWQLWEDQIEIEVKDNGLGIKPEHLSRIFDPFFTTKDEGTGMGLSICHRIIQEHGGQIHVVSQPGRGTSFHIYLPTKQWEDNMQIGSEELRQKKAVSVLRE